VHHVKLKHMNIYQALILTLKGQPWVNHI